MGTLGSAFDTIIVGALALPWVLLVIHLFFAGRENSLKSLLQRMNKQIPPAVAGVLLFAMAYPAGSVVSRLAQDFFDDDDLHFRVWNYLFRVGVTESSIRTNVYCNIFRRQATTPKSSDPVAQKRVDFTNNDPECNYTGKWIVRQGYQPRNVAAIDDTTSANSLIDRRWIDSQWVTRQLIERQEDLADQIFRAQEASVLLKGTDANERLRQFHDQIMVLRGAAFNGIVALSLCWFWWSAQLSSWLRWASPLPHLFPAAIATANHIREHLDSPPYMEFTLLILAAGGWHLLLRHRPRSRRSPDGQVSHPDLRQHRLRREGAREIHVAYVVLCLLLTTASFLGWWATQVLYDQQVIYSYKAQSEQPEHSASAAK